MGVPLIRNSDIKENRVRQSKLIYLNPKFAKENESRSIKYRDVVTVHTGDIGTSAVIPKELNGCQGFATINTRVNDILIDPYFLCWFFNTDSFTNFCMSVSTGDGRSNLNLKDFVKARILYPPLPEQQKIATILTSVDEVIEKTEAQINKLQDLKKGMTQELLTKGVGTNGVPHTEFKDSPVGRIPKGWEVCTIGELLSSNVIGSIQDGNHGEKHPKSADFVPEGIPFVMASDIHNQEIDFEGANKIPEEIYSGLRIGFSRAGDVLLSHKATVGLTAVVPDNVTRLMLTPQVTYYRIEDHSTLYNWYLHYCFQSGYFQDRISILSAQSTRSYIGIKAQADLSIALPNDIEEQLNIVEILKSLDGKIRLTKTKLRSLRSIKKALMQDLLTGKVRVKINKNDKEVI